MFKNKFSKADKAAKKQAQQPVFKQDYFDNNCHRTYSCIHCRAHLANHDELISKLFQGNQGRAYLFNKVVNIGCKQAVQRELLTGLHAVADIYCDNCETPLGWKYEQAFVPSQKYKEGKYIIELVHMLKENDWDLTSYNTRELLRESNSINELNLINNYKIGDNYIGPPNKYKLFSSQLSEDKNQNINGNSIERESTSNNNNINDISVKRQMFTFESRSEITPSLTASEAMRITPKSIALAKQIINVKSCLPILSSSRDEIGERVNNGADDTKIDNTDQNDEKLNINSNNKENNDVIKMRSSITTTDNLNLLSASSKNSLSSSRSQSDISSYVSMTDNSGGSNSNNINSNSSDSSRADEDPPFELCPMSPSSILEIDAKIHDKSSLSSPSSSSLSSSSKSALTRDISNRAKVSPIASETRIKVSYDSTDEPNSNMNTSVL